MSLKGTKMGWILWLYKSQKPLCQSDVWIKCCTLSTGNMNTFPSIISSCKSFPVGLKGNNRCTQNKFSFLCWPIQRKCKTLFCLGFFNTSLFRQKFFLREFEVLYKQAGTIISTCKMRKWEEKKSKGSRVSFWVTVLCHTTKPPSQYKPTKHINLQ